MAEIVRTDDVLGGDPRIDGTRSGVLDVHEFVVTGDRGPADVADQLDLTLEEVYSALAYYYAHPDEMRQVRRTRGGRGAARRPVRETPENGRVTWSF